MSKIMETTNYNKFELHNFNRALRPNTKKFRNLVESMKKYGWIDAYPLHVIKNGDGKFKIKSGHHRFEAARILGIGVKYVVCNDSGSLTEYENSSRPWNLEDFLCGYTNQGFKGYNKLSAYRRQYGLPLLVSSSLLRGMGGATSGTQSENFKNGSFEVGNPTHANNVGDMVLFCEELGIDFCRNSRFVLALSRVMFVDGIDFEELKKKIKSHIYLVKKQPDVAGYVRMLEEVYNRQRSKKLAIAINALS